MSAIRDVEDWVKLPEFEIPVIKNEMEKGCRVNVRRVGRLLATLSDCRGFGILEGDVDGWISLPTITIIEDSKEKFYRLPLGLNEWAEFCLGGAASDMLHFPCLVEFCILRGQPYADFVI